MDPRLEPPDAPREGVPVGLANQPLVAAAWRLLRSGVRAAADERRQADGGWLALGEALWQLSCLPAGEPDNSATKERLAAVERLGQATEALGLRVVGPLGAPYEGELTELLQNVAQVPATEPGPPRVASVLEPAVLHEGRVLRLGRAVITRSVDAGEGS